MSETGDMLAQMADRLLTKQFDDTAMRAARAGGWPQPAWDAIEEQGMAQALVQGDAGFGVPLLEGLALIRQLGRHAVPLPLAETMIANALLADAGLPTVPGVIALVPEGAGITLHEQGGGWQAHGEADRIAWGRNAQALLIEDAGRLALLRDGFRTVAEGSNLADMPRDRIAAEGGVEIAPAGRLSILEAGAIARALAMAGALDTLVRLTVAHVSERKQFGRALSANQAIQHALSRLAGEAAAASAAADLAAEAFATPGAGCEPAIAAARCRIGEAAGIAVGIAHQLHGAIGFTAEHRLHWFTTALWSWRDEFGSAAWWTRRLGATALDRPASAYWPFITSV